MIVNPKLKNNKYKAVSLPRNRDLFARVGRRVLPDMADGQVANFASDTMSQLDNVETQYLRPSQMPSDTKV